MSSSHQHKKSNIDFSQVFQDVIHVIFRADSTPFAPVVTYLTWTPVFLLEHLDRLQSEIDRYLLPTLVAELRVRVQL
ncbi:hypothetical protein WAI453_010146 [Rhynchosporium graminicola]